MAGETFQTWQEIKLLATHQVIASVVYGYSEINSRLCQCATFYMKLIEAEIYMISALPKDVVGFSDIFLGTGQLLRLD